MKTKTAITLAEVNHIATLANLPISEGKLQEFVDELSQILELVNKLNALDTTGVEPTSQVTGLENVLREDIVEPSLSQEEALKNAPKTHKGYFVVKAIFED